MNDAALLLVDDERPILNVLTRLLRKEPYRILTAQCGEEALEMLSREAVQVVVSDFRMPGMSGIDLLREVKQRYPNTVRVVVSGYADGRLIMDSINVGEVYRFLPKPWNDEELIVTLRQCFAQHRLICENERLIGQVRAQNEELREMNDLLEQAVDQRTRSLQLSQEILEKLPVPVLGVSPDGTVVLVNAAVREIVTPDGPLPLGAHLRDVFEDGVVEQVEACLNAGRDVGSSSGSGRNGSANETNAAQSGRATDPPQPARCILNDDEYRVHIRMLNEGGDLRGCTLVLEPRYDDDYSYSFDADSAAC